MALAIAGEPTPVPKIEVWDGKPYEGKTLLVHTEQGFGDAIQFLRYFQGQRLLEDVGLWFVATSASCSRKRCSGEYRTRRARSPMPAADLQRPLSLPDLQNDP